MSRLGFRHMSRLRHLSPFVPVLWLALLILTWPGTAGAIYELYSFDNDDNFDQWQNHAGAYGFDPGCQDCPCSNGETAYNTVASGTRRLFCGDFRHLDGSYFSLADGEVITGVHFNVHGRYSGADGGSFNNRIRWGETVIGVQNPGNSFTNNSICRWRIPAAFSDLTSMWDWNADPDDPFFDLNIGVQRHDNTTTMRINAVRLRVRTARTVPDQSAIHYGGVYVNEPVDRSFRIQSVGDDPISGNVALAAGCTGFSIVAGGGPYTLSPGQYRDVVVRFAPPDDDYYYCDVTLGIRDLAVQLDGHGIGPVCTVTGDSSHDFGNVVTGTSAEWSFSVRNDGGGVLAGVVSTGSCDTGQFTIVGGAGSYSLSRGQTRNVTVRFAPTVADFFDCDIELGNEDCLGPYVYGAGVNPACSTTPDEIDFGAVVIGELAESSFVVRNDGAEGILSGVVQLDPGLCDAGFEIVSGGGAYALSSGQSRTVTLRFTAVDEDFYSCFVETGCEDVFLYGEGVQPGQCVLSDTTMEFDALPGEFDEQSIFIDNVGGAPIAGRVELDAACDTSVFEIVEGGGDYIIDPDDFLTVTVRFTPPAEGGAFDCLLLTGCGSVAMTGGIVAADEHAPAPDATSVDSPRPNPSRAGTQVRLALAETATVRIAVYDVQGRLVALVADRVLIAGWHDIRWDGRTSGGVLASPGVYFVRVDVDSVSRTSRLVIR